MKKILCLFCLLFSLLPSKARPNTIDDDVVKLISIGAGLGSGFVADVIFYEILDKIECKLVKEKKNKKKRPVYS